MARRLIPLFILIAFTFAACSQATEPVTDPPTATIPVVEDEPVAPTLAATELALPTEPVQPTVEQPEATQQQPTDLPAESTATVAPPTEVAVFNGGYENTYFRGSETSPVTLIDYSDFL